MNENQDPRPTQTDGDRRRARAKAMRRSLLWQVPLVLVITFILLLFYEFANIRGWQFVFWIYYAALAGLTLGYVVWNRGFSENRLTRDSLPSDWDDARKDEYLLAIAVRRRRSSWMPLLILPFFLTFCYDIGQLFFSDFFGKLLTLWGLA